MLLVLLAAFFALPPVEYRLLNLSGQNLFKDGFTSFESRPSDLIQETLERLPQGYIFLDYSYSIKGDSLVTWHRDVTSGQSYHGTLFPTYTLIHYLCDGDLLTVSPGSHLTLPFSFGQTFILNGWNGTAVLFNADLLHAGAPNRIGAARHAVQYKLAHRSDLPRLTHLDGVHATKIGNGGYSYLDAFRRWYSWKFAWISNTVLYPLMQRRLGGILGIMQRIINLDFYNNA